MAHNLCFPLPVPSTRPCRTTLLPSLPAPTFSPLHGCVWAQSIVEGSALTESSSARVSRGHDTPEHEASLLGAGAQRADLARADGVADIWEVRPFQPTAFHEC